MSSTSRHRAIRSCSFSLSSTSLIHDWNIRRWCASALGQSCLRNISIEIFRPFWRWISTCSNARASLLHQRLGLISSLVTRSASKWEISKQCLDSQCRKISRITCISLRWRKLASSASASSIGGSTKHLWDSLNFFSSGRKNSGSSPLPELPECRSRNRANGMAKGSPVSPKSQRSKCSNWDSLSDSSEPCTPLRAKSVLDKRQISLP